MRIYGKTGQKWKMVLSKFHYHKIIYLKPGNLNMNNYGIGIGSKEY